MIVGVVKEIKNNEYRVGLTPGSVSSFVQAGHQVLVESGAGVGAGFSDAEYAEAGGVVEATAKDVWTKSDMIVKVKEPGESEFQYFRKDLILFCYLQLAADRALAEALLSAGVKAIAYETIVGKNNSLPCLMPMSLIAGRMSIQEGAKYLEKTYGGRGVLLAGVPGVERGHIVILGGGGVGTSACKVAIGMGARVTVLDVNIDRLNYLDDIFSHQITTLYSSRDNILRSLADADLVIGAVLLRGRRTPTLIRKEDLSIMRPGSVIVDVAVDQGGCAETSHPTTHDDPIFIENGVVHYCVASMPGAVARTSAQALGNATLPYGLEIANKGVEEACKADAGLMQGLNCYCGKCTLQGAADAMDIPYVDPTTIL